MTAIEPSELPIQIWLRNLAAFAKRYRLGRFFAFALAVAALASGVATYVVLTQSTFEGDPGRILFLLTVDLVLLLLLAVVIIRRIVLAWSARRKGSAGSRLHVRLVLLFGLISAVPAIIVAVFSLLFFNFGLESWFSERVRTTVSESLAVADAYLEEHKRNIEADVLQMAWVLDRNAVVLQTNLKRFVRGVDLQAELRNLTEAVVFNSSLKVVARSGLTAALEFEPIPPAALQKARDGEVAILTSASEDRVRALVRLNNFIEDHYLYVGRFVEPRVLGHMERARGAVAQFENLELRRSDLQIQFLLIFSVVALLLLLAAIWVGLNVATRLSQPISVLITATEKIRTGDLSARVPEQDFSRDELGMLGRAFNRMTSDLSANQQELMNANQQIDARRLFTETVLAGVSSGVIGLDGEGRINLPNRSASMLLDMQMDQLVGSPLDEVMPEFAGLVEAARQSTDRRFVERQIKIDQGLEARTLLVRVGASRIDDDIQGYVVTFDDVSELLSAQRKAAWADVARRIAHEIKNPLTPIQLSAERLKRKYLKEITTDKDVFEACTDTIVRQVDDIGRMVDEFSNFARMPAPVMKMESITDIARQAEFMQRNAHRDIEYKSNIPAEGIMAKCDSRQISQALTNLLQNAFDAIEGREKDQTERGRIELKVAVKGTQTVISVTDNGKGLPKKDRSSLTEPYVTTRSKGTGLGLAIVKKIMEDHDGQLTLEDGPHGGACVSLILPATAEPVQQQRDKDRQSGIHGA